MRRIESALHLDNIILVQSSDLDDRTRRVSAGVAAPDLLLHLVAHGPVLRHIGHVDDKTKARVDVGALHLDEGLHVLVGLTDAGEAGLDELAGDGVNAAHAWVRVSFHLSARGITAKIWMLGRGGWGRRRWWWFEFTNLQRRGCRRRWTSGSRDQWCRRSHLGCRLRRQLEKSSSAEAARGTGPRWEGERGR